MTRAVRCGGLVTIQKSLSTRRPVAFFHTPVATALAPDRRRVHIAGAFGDPYAGGPGVAAGAPFPVAGRPYIAIARMRYALKARRWRGDDDFFVGDGLRLYCHPAATVEAPVIAFLYPDGTAVLIAAPFAHPDATVPYMAVAIPVPVAWRPDITAARRRHAFEAGWRWGVVDDDADVNPALRHGLRRQEGASADGKYSGCIDGEGLREAFHHGLHFSGGMKWTIAICWR